MTKVYTNNFLNRLALCKKEDLNQEYIPKRKLAKNYAKASIILCQFAFLVATEITEKRIYRATDRQIVVRKCYFCLFLVRKNRCKSFLLHGFFYTR